MSTEIKGWQCDHCLHAYKKKQQADQCEKNHKPEISKWVRAEVRCPGCGDTECNGECEISDMDFGN